MMKNVRGFAFCVAALLLFFALPRPAAAAVTFTFGGNGYCTYQGTINVDSLKITYNADNSLATANLLATYTESIVGTCPYAPLDVQHWSFSLAGSTFYSNRLRVNFVGASENMSVTLTSYDGIFDNKSSAGNVTFQRSDDAVAAVKWAVNVPITMSPD